MPSAVTESGLSACFTLFGDGAALVRAAARDYAIGSDCAVGTPAADARWWLVGGLIT